MNEPNQAVADVVTELLEKNAMAMMHSRGLRIESIPLSHLVLATEVRQNLAKFEGIPKRLKTRLEKPEAVLTISDALCLIRALLRNVTNRMTPKNLALLQLAAPLADAVTQEFARHDEFVKATRKREPAAATETVYQFKISLRDSKPRIWRRIQVQDCTLDQLHEDIQTAMGWTNSHLHQFEIGGKCFGDPELLEDDGVADSTTTMLHELFPEDGQKTRFTYEYDFGDGWIHEIMFERSLRPEKSKTYPLCLKGEMACPPEDVGGIWGYYSFLEAIADPKHEDHELYMEWCEGFDPEEFNPEETTRMMREGMPNWRD
jgi:hypothetical protein